MKKLLPNGATLMFRGARRGQSMMAGLGAAVMVYGWLKRLDRPRKDLIYSRKLKDGEGLTIRMFRGDTLVDEQTVEG